MDSLYEFIAKVTPSESPRKEGIVGNNVRAIDRLHSFQILCCGKSVGQGDVSLSLFCLFTY